MRIHSCRFENDRIKRLNGVACGFVEKQIRDKEKESAEQDQTARMCSLILLYTLRKINAYKRTAVQGFKSYNTDR